MTNRTEPTADELHDGVRRLAAEVDASMQAPQWAILNAATERVMWRLYSGAAMVHCVSLLLEMDKSAQADHGLTTRIIGRVHQEAFLYALYLHFGGPPAVERLYQHEFAAVKRAHEACALWDRQLAAEKKKQRRRLKKVRSTNKGISDGTLRIPTSLLSRSSPNPMCHSWPPPELT